MRLPHEPVLRDQSVELWASPSATRVVDATAGRAGHSLALLGNRPDVNLLALDRDPEAVDFVRKRLSGFGGRTEVVHAPFGELAALLRDRGGPVDGVLLDLGVSSPQIDDAERGFSLRQDGPLDLRFDTSSGETAADWLRHVDEEELSATLRDLGEVPRARAVARAILRARNSAPLETTHGLREAAAAAIRRAREPAEKSLARVFQAIRIRVNDELGELDRLLESLPDVLAPSGRIVVLAYHSLEDRRVKRAFQEASRDCVCPPELPVCACGGGRAWLRAITKRPITADPEEVRANPRARSARLRAAERVSPRDEGSAS